MNNNWLNVPWFSSKGFIGFIAEFHTAVASLAIGLAFVVTICQIVAYRAKSRRYDLYAKRAQLLHVCVYNIGTINAIGLVFALSGLFPQFFSQLFVHFFWALIIEEFIFFLLATTLTFHYFFWDSLWGHKKLHIFLGALMTPLFFLQFFIIHGVGGFMLTPGAFEEGTLSLSRGILGWDMSVFYNPSLLMLTMHRLFANISYGGFFIAGWSGLRLFFTRDPQKRDYYEEGGRLSFYIGFASLLALPIVGYFYSVVIQREANEAFWNLMLGRGDIVVWGIDLWWLKHIFVVTMIGGALGYFSRTGSIQPAEKFSMPKTLIYAVAAFYIAYYLSMGMVMTWAFFWWMLAFGVAAYLLTKFQVWFSKGSGRAVFLMLGILSFGTVMLGGWAREASRPRFVNRYSHYDPLYVPQERQPYLLIELEESELPPIEPVVEVQAAELIRTRCVGCHDLDRVRDYRGDDWERVVRLMITYGTRLNDQEMQAVIEHLEAGLPY